MKILLSWSGNASHGVARALRTWLGIVLPGVETFVSSADIRKGAIWFDELSAVLEGTAFGVFCIVPGNESEPWLHFEAGAVAKQVGKAHVAPFLLGVSPGQLRGPLAMFQATIASDKDDVFRLATSLAGAVGNDDLDSLRGRFERAWPGFAAELVAYARGDEAPAEAKAEKTEGISPQINNLEATVLSRVANLGGHRVPLGRIRAIAPMSDFHFSHWLAELEYKNLVEVFDVAPEGPAVSLTRTGRNLVVERGWV